MQLKKKTEICWIRWPSYWQSFYQWKS